MLVPLLFISCLEDADKIESKLTQPNDDLSLVRNWFETHKEELRKDDSGINLRTAGKDLILPFFEKEPDWSNFSEYHFSDERKVYEIHISKLSGLVPKEFFEKYGTSGSDLVEETLMFVEHPDSEKGYTVLVARYFSYGQKSKGMTYHRIPKEWSGRIDIFTYTEQHLRSFEVEEGRLTSYHIYQTEDLSKRIQTHNALMTCTGYWVEFPYTYGIHMGIGSSHSIYVTTCHNPDPFGGGTGTGTWPSTPVVSPDYLGGGYTGGGGDGTSPSGGGSTGTTYCDNTNHFGSDCIPFPLTIEEYIESLNNPDQKRQAQLDYLKTHGGREFVTIIDELLNTSGLNMGDLTEINKLVNDFYLRQRGLFFMAIFSPENVGTILTFALANPNMSTLARNRTFQLFSRYATQGENIVYKSFTSSNFRANLTLKTGMNPSSAQAHHVFPQASEFASFFSSRGINVHNPAYGAWWPTASHQQNWYAYNQAWRNWIALNEGASPIQVIDFARKLMNQYGIAVLF